MGWRVLVIALYGWIAVQFGQFIVNLDYVAGDGVNVWFGTGRVVWLAAIVALVATLITAIIFMVWVYRAMARARELTPALTITPGWGFGWFFVPVASLWMPYSVMTEIVEGSGVSTPADVEQTRTLIGWWWGAWIVRSLLLLFVSFASPASESGGSVNTRTMAVMALASAIGIGSAWALSMIVRRVARLQASAVGVAQVFA